MRHGAWIPWNTANKAWRFQPVQAHHLFAKRRGGLEGRVIALPDAAVRFTMNRSPLLAELGGDAVKPDRRRAGASSGRGQVCRYSFLSLEPRLGNSKCLFHKFDYFRVRPPATRNRSATRSTPRARSCT